MDLTAGLEKSPSPFAINGKRAVIRLKKELYPLDIIYTASYTYIDKCYILLDTPDDQHIDVQLIGKDQCSQEELQHLCGEFSNRLLNEIRRADLARQNEKLIESVVTRALAGALNSEMDPETEEALLNLEELEQMDLTEQPFDDPLGIAIPWEEKYGNKTKDGTKNSKGAGQGEKEVIEKPEPGE